MDDYYFPSDHLNISEVRVVEIPYLLKYIEAVERTGRELIDVEGLMRYPEMGIQPISGYDASRSDFESYEDFISVVKTFANKHKKIADGEVVLDISLAPLSE